MKKIRKLILIRFLLLQYTKYKRYRSAKNREFNREFNRAWKLCFEIENKAQRRTAINILILHCNTIKMCRELSDSVSRLLVAEERVRTVRYR